MTKRFTCRYFKLPAQRAAGVRVDTRAGLVDVAPTLLKEIGVAAPKEMQGEPLLSDVRDHSPTVDRAAYAETDYPHRAFGWSSLRALRSGKYLYIQAPQPELYNQADDAQSAHNLVPQAKAVGETLGAQLNSFRSKTSVALTELAGLLTRLKNSKPWVTWVLMPRRPILKLS